MWGGPTRWCPSTVGTRWLCGGGCARCLTTFSHCRSFTAKSTSVQEGPGKARRAMSARLYNPLAFHLADFFFLHACKAESLPVFNKPVEKWNPCYEVPALKIQHRMKLFINQQCLMGCVWVGAVGWWNYYSILTCLGILWECLSLPVVWLTEHSVFRIWQRAGSRKQSAFLKTNSCLLQICMGDLHLLFWFGWAHSWYLFVYCRK